MAVSDKAQLAEMMKAMSGHAYLATCDGDQPVVRSVSPIVEKDLSLWVTTSAHANKVKQIRKNPKVCLFFVEQPAGEKAAAAYGKAEIVSDLQTKKRVWALATFDLLQYFPDGPESAAFSLLKVVPDEVRWRDSWTGGEKTYRPAKP
jgi:general stress protein 26